MTADVVQKRRSRRVRPLAHAEKDDAEYWYGEYDETQKALDKLGDECRRAAQSILGDIGAMTVTEAFNAVQEQLAVAVEAEIEHFNDPQIRAGLEHAAAVIRAFEKGKVRT